MAPASSRRRRGERLTVVNVAYPFAGVGDDAVGGAEQVLTLVDRALVNAGHQSIVIAQAGSSCRGLLLPSSSANEQRTILDERALAVGHARAREALRLALSSFDVDVVHMHGHDFHKYLPPPGPPVLVTLHLPASFYPESALRPARPRTFLHCVSASQRRSLPAGVPLLDDIPNGVHLVDFEPSGGKDRYAFMMGRVCPEKGFHIAIEAAKRAGAPLFLAGQVFPYETHERYFRDVIQPALDAERRFIGPVGLVEKKRWLARARCLLIPSLAAETSSLVAMEALASGTPVIALRAGALVDIVEHGRTGFLVSDVDEMADAISRAGSIRPEDCCRAAEQRFSAASAAGLYLERYRQLARAPITPDRRAPCRTR